MNTLLVVILLLCYLAIAVEQPLRICKSATALFGAGILWTCYVVLSGSSEAINQLDDTLTSAAKIVFFLISAMTIVEVIDAQDGFEIMRHEWPRLALWDC